MRANVNLDTSEFERRLAEVLKKFPQAGEEMLEKACLVVEAKAKDNAPVDNGTLRASITHKVIKQGNAVEGYIFTNEEYAPYVEFGTGIFADNGSGRQTPWKFKDKNGQWHQLVGQAPKKFISNAITSEADKVRQVFRGFLDYV